MQNNAENRYMKITVLDKATLGEDIDLSPIERIASPDVYDITPPAEVVSRLSGSDVCVMNKVKLTADILSKLDRLSLICVAATGYDNVDTEYCKAHGIALCNVPGYSSESVSQLTLAMVLSASVNLRAYRESVASGRYTEGNVQNILTPVYHELCGKTWGIVGYGGIGRRVADVARALGCKIKICKRTPVEGVDCVSLEELARTSDIISLHVPLNASTEKMINGDIISLMKDGVILVNVARGKVTDEQALADAVLSGKIGFLGCDVYSTEPMPSDHPFYPIKDMQNVCLTPHMAWGAYEARNRCIEEIAKNIESFAIGEKRNRIV